MAAEYGHLAAAEVSLAHGAAVDAQAAVDADGLNGHTPLFHTVNSNAKREGLTGRQPRQAFERYMASDFIEHKPDVDAGTREAMATFLEALIKSMPF